MGHRSTMWEEQSQHRADEISRALVRVGVMTNGQIARLLNVDPRIAKITVSRHWDRFEEQHKVPKGVAGGRYVVPGNRVMSLIRLSDQALAKWAKDEGIGRVRNRVRPSVLPQVLNVGELLIRMRHAGVAYEDWDIMLSQSNGEGLHADLVKRGEDGEAEFTLGLYLLPMRLSEVEQGKKGLIFHGILRRVLQNSRITNTLFLVPRQYYLASLKTLSKLDKAGRYFYLLPLESFVEHPRWFLEAIRTDDHQQRVSLINDALDWDEKAEPPYGLRFASLLRFYKADNYRFVDTWVNGSVDRVRQWMDYTTGYQIPKTGYGAGADVYVQDDVMREALEKVLRMKKRDHYNHSIVYTEPWLEGMCTPEPKAAGPAERAPLVDPEDLKFDESWLKYFNED